jgi:hypothetical protein
MDYYHVMLMAMPFPLAASKPFFQASRFFKQAVFSFLSSSNQSPFLLLRN